jgi:spore germination cell wall hydrolase CwlJ-like protein
MYLKMKEQELLFHWQTLVALLMIMSAIQFTMLRPQEVQATVYKQNAETIQPIKVEPVAPVKPKFLQIVDTNDKVRYSKQDVFCMAKNIYHEAGSEPKLGKYAVAQVTINRMKSPMYGDRVCSVVFEPYQFSWANYHGRRWTTPSGPNWREAKRIAVDVLENGKRIHGMSDVLFYHATYVRPSWSYRKDRLTRIGLHIFYEPRNRG